MFSYALALLTPIPFPCSPSSPHPLVCFPQSVPLLYLPLEAVASKFYGESERLLSSVFSLAGRLHEKGAIIFLDEVRGSFYGALIGLHARGAIVLLMQTR